MGKIYKGEMKGEYRIDRIAVPHLNVSTSTLTKEKQGVDIQLLGKFQIGGLLDSFAERGNEEVKIINFTSLYNINIMVTNF